jgi:hypothetical protein
MKEKLFYSDTFNLTPGDFDHHLRLKPYSIFNLFQEVASQRFYYQFRIDELQDRSLETHQKQIYYTSNNPASGKKCL